MSEQLTEILNERIETSSGHPFTPLEVVCLKTTKNSNDVLHFLLDIGADPNAYGSYPLMIAAQAYKNSLGANQEENSTYGLQMIQSLLEAGANPFRFVNGRFRLTAFQYMLGLDFPVDVIEFCLNKLTDGTFTKVTESVDHM